MSLTPCPDLDRLVDDAAAGLPGAAERLDAHAATCAACLAEADALDDGFGDALACLGEETCPPEVLTAVFAEVGAPVRTRPAPLLAADRPARPSTRPASRRVWAGIVAAAALVALVTFWPSAEAPLVAETRPAEITHAETSPPETPGATEVAPVETSPEPITARPTPVARAPRAAQRRASPAPRRRHIAEPRPVPETPIERPDLTDDPDFAAAPTPADTAAARQDLLLAFGIVARAQRRADAVVHTEMQRVSAALEPAQLIQ